MAIGTSIVRATMGARSRHQGLPRQHLLGGREHREGDDAQAQGRHGEDETDPVAESDQLSSLAGRIWDT